MMACVDIYQALTEDRPYKKGLSHEKTCDILDDMSQKGFIDSDISKTIRELNSMPFLLHSTLKNIGIR